MNQKSTLYYKISRRVPNGAPLSDHLRSLRIIRSDRIEPSHSQLVRIHGHTHQIAEQAAPGIPAARVERLQWGKETKLFDCCLKIRKKKR